MADQAKRAPKKAPRMRLSQEQRERFLEVLGETGNRRLAAEAIGVEPRLMDQRRRFDRLLDTQWREALERAERRLAGARGPLDTGRAFNVIRKSPQGRTQIVAAGPKRWSQKVEARFLAALGMCGNVAAAARAVGFSESAIWQRRRRFTDFARALEEALEDAEMRIEFRMATMGSDFAVADMDREPRIEGGAGGAEDGWSVAAVEAPDVAPVPFDADTALRFLKWREEKRRGGGQRGRLAALPPIEDVRTRIINKVAAVKRHRDKQKLAEGWTQDEEGYMIPPGWTRALPPAEEGGRASAGPELEQESGQDRSG